MLVREKPVDAGDVIMSCSCDEEHQMSGIAKFADGWGDSSGDVPDWVSRRPDLAIIAEPPSLDIVVAHRGVTRWKLRVTGRASHSSRPSEGINAIYRYGEGRGPLGGICCTT